MTLSERIDRVISFDANPTMGELKVWQRLALLLEQEAAADEASEDVAGDTCEDSFARGRAEFNGRNIAAVSQRVYKLEDTIKAIRKILNDLTI